MGLHFSLKEEDLSLKEGEFSLGEEDFSLREWDFSLNAWDILELDPRVIDGAGVSLDPSEMSWRC